MSKIKSKLDQKEVMGGKVTEEQKQKAQAAKDASSKGPAEGEEVKLSKKELNKLKKKENKANAKANAKGGDGNGAGEESKQDW